MAVESKFVKTPMPITSLCSLTGKLRDQLSHRCENIEIKYLNSHGDIETRKFIEIYKCKKGFYELL